MISKADGKVPIVVVWLLLASVLVVVYAFNRQIQVKLGENALAQNPLTIYSLPEALSEAQATNKPILANMSAIWCPVCRRLDSEIFTHPMVKDYISEHYVYARIEYESTEGREFSIRYRVLGFPTLMLLTPEGDEIHNVPVVFEPQVFVSNLKEATMRGNRP